MSNVAIKHPVDTIAIYAPGSPFDGVRFQWNGDRVMRLRRTMTAGEGFAEFVLKTASPSEPVVEEFKLEQLTFMVDGVLKDYAVMIPAAKTMHEILKEVLDLTITAERPVPQAMMPPKA